MHIGIIPDGNRRWASQHNADLQRAYEVGFNKVIQLCLAVIEVEVKHITFYGLSNDNYTKRSASMVEQLLSFILEEMDVASKILTMRGIGVRFFGDTQQLSSHHRIKLDRIEASTAPLSSPVARMNILINYSPVWDLGAGIQNHGTLDIPSCDLVFRSGGMQRLSGFLPLQSANAELCFSAKLWPDVDEHDLLRAIDATKIITRNLGA